MVFPNYGHHDCSILYRFYNINCEHLTGTLANCNKCYASLLIVPCIENLFYYNKLNSTKKDVVILKNIAPCGRGGTIIPPRWSAACRKRRLNGILLREVEAEGLVLSST